MRILTIAAAVLAVGAASAAAADDARLSDSQFIKAGHCRGLATGETAAKLDTIIKVQKRGRSDHIVDQAWTARTDAERLARKDATAAKAAWTTDCDKFGV